MAIKTVTNKEIEALDYLRSLPGNGYIKALTGYCKNYQLTEDFVREFKSDISKELLSLSPKLMPTLVETFPELFDFEIWENSKAKSAELFTSEDFRKRYNAADLEKYLLEINPYELSEELFNKIFPFSTDNVKETLLKIYKGSLSKDFLFKNISFITPEAINNQDGIAEFTKDDLEKLIKLNKNLTVHFVTTILLKLNDIAWQERICDEILEGKIALVESKGTFDSDLKRAVFSMHEDALKKLFTVLKTHDENAITYNVLKYLLETKNPDEDFCLLLLDNFKHNNLVQALGKYAKAMDYNTILVGLFL